MTMKTFAILVTAAVIIIVIAFGMSSSRPLKPDQSAITPPMSWTLHSITASINDENAAVKIWKSSAPIPCGCTNGITTEFSVGNLFWCVSHGNYSPDMKVWKPMRVDGPQPPTDPMQPVQITTELPKISE